jgi:hypothetical protein
MGAQVSAQVEVHGPVELQGAGQHLREDCQEEAVGHLAVCQGGSQEEGCQDQEAGEVSWAKVTVGPGPGQDLCVLMPGDQHLR